MSGPNNYYYFPKWSAEQRYEHESEAYGGQDTTSITW